MGTHVRLVVGPGPRDPERALADARTWLQDAALRLSRFEPGSELCALNADPRREVPASPLLRAAVGAGRWAAERTGGLVDPTLLGALERAGYERSRTDARPAPLTEALAAAPDRRPARPHPAARWREVEVRGDAVIRPPGVRLDTGGTGKGLLADALAHRLAGQDWATIDCGGDIRVTGAPFPVDVRHPLSGAVRTAPSPTTCSTRPPASPRGRAWSARPPWRPRRWRPRRWPSSRC
jgi:thiamine biosynthesis lipoprotein